MPNKDVVVSWNEWEQTFFHPCAPLGSYFPKSRTFKSKDEANGFAQGLKYNPRIRNVKIGEE